MRTPSSEAAKRIAKLFSRRLTTVWAEKEVRSFRKLAKAHCFASLDDLELIERYYAFERRKGDKGIHRRDLYTFINNWHGELDRATEWGRTHPVKTERKIIPMPPVQSEEPYAPPSDPESIAHLARFEEERRLRKLARGKS